MNRNSYIFIIACVIVMIILLMPNKLEYYRFEQDFKVDMSNIDIDEKFRKEEWLPNGDGEKIIILTYNQLNNSFKKLNKLPIKEDLPPNGIPKRFLNITNGYYKYIIDENDNRNFGIIIVDLKNKEICIYYQIM